MIQTSNPQKNINTKYWQQRANNPIVKGYFPKYKSYRELAIAKVNRVLCVLLGIALCISFVSYYFVTYNEVILDNVGQEITEVKAQNMELQNKLDNLKSYYNVDKTVREKNLLQKPQQVVEVSSPQEYNDTETAKEIKALAPQSNDNYNWAVGF